MASSLQQCALKNLQICLLILSRDGNVVEVNSVDENPWFNKMFIVGQNILEREDVDEDLILNILEQDQGELIIDNMKYLFKGCEIIGDQKKIYRSVMIFEDFTIDFKAKEPAENCEKETEISGILLSKTRKKFELSTESSDSFREISPQNKLLRLGSGEIGKIKIKGQSEIVTPLVIHDEISRIIDQIPCGIMLVDSVTGIIKKINKNANWLHLIENQQFEFSINKFLRNKLISSSDCDKLLLANHECKLEYKLYNTFNRSIKIKTLDQSSQGGFPSKLIHFTCRPNHNHDTNPLPLPSAPLSTSGQSKGTLSGMSISDLPLSKSQHPMFVWTISDVVNDKGLSSSVLESMQHTSHDMRTPLQAILLAAHSIKSNSSHKDGIDSMTHGSMKQGRLVGGRTKSVDVEFLEDIDTIISSGSVLEGIMSNIIDFKTIQSTVQNGSNRIISTPVPFDVVENITRIVDMLKSSTLLFDKVNLTSSFDHNLLKMNQLNTKLRLDKVMFNRIMQNLISNGLKFTNQGSVDISCSLHQQNKVFDETDELLCNPELNHEALSLRITVTDTGCGMNEWLTNKVKESNIVRTRSNSEESSSSDSSDSSNEKVGLGTLIVTAYVEALGGHIDFDSVLGQGTKVTLDLPTYFVHGNVVDASNIKREEVVVHAIEPQVDSTVASTVEIIPTSSIKRKIIPEAIDSMIASTTSSPCHLYDISPSHPPPDIASFKTWDSLNGYKSLLQQAELGVLGEDNGEKREKVDKVLVVEDVNVNRKLIVKALQRGGFIVDQAENGKIALEMMCKNKYRTVFMDINMPIMNGDKAVKEYWKYYKSKQLEIQEGASASTISLNKPPRIVILTGNITETDRKKALACGAHDFLTKPVVPKQLLEAASV